MSVLVPPGWIEEPSLVPGAKAARRSSDGRWTVIAAIEEHNGSRWLHVSTARNDRLPTWAELRRVKDDWIGRYRKAIQVLPNEAEYVNQHPNCLHLFACVSDADWLPDFTRGSGSL